MYKKPIKRFGRIVRALVITVVLGGGVFYLGTLADKADTVSVFIMLNPDYQTR